MVRPSVLSVGIGVGVLMLSGSGIAIPTLWSRANRAEDAHAALDADVRSLREARDSSDAKLLAARLKLADLKQDLETSEESLAAVRESQRILTSQLAETQARNRELSGVDGTLKLRDAEVATLVQQLEQLRSDHRALLANGGDKVADADASAPAGSAADVAVSSSNTGARKTGSTGVTSLDNGDLVPVPKDLGTSNDVATTRAKSAAQPSQVAAKPSTAGTIRFDDSGWKTVASGSPSVSVLGYPTIDSGTTFSSPTIQYAYPSSTVAPNAVVVP